MKRIAESPTYLEYVTRWCLLPKPPLSDLLESDSNDPANSGLRWFDIPSYQRGLVWDEDLFDNLLFNKSQFLGNVIFVELPVRKHQDKFTSLPSNVSKYDIVIDGLQRFSIGTALLNVLHPLCLCDNPDIPQDARDFSLMKEECSGLDLIYFHNDMELRNHDRSAIRKSYEGFVKKLRNWVNRKRKEDKSFIKKIESMLLERKVTTDVYSGFDSPYELVNTFIGLNVTRVQLSDTDWLRAIIIDQGSSSGWKHADLEIIDNMFTDTFAMDGSKQDRELLPFVRIVKDMLVSPVESDPGSVFGSWKSHPSPELDIEDVKRFISFVDKMKNFSGNSCYDEIRRCGALPFCSLIAYYYGRMLSDGDSPGFLDRESSEDDDLAVYLRACYRILIDGSVGKIKFMVRSLLSGQGGTSPSKDDSRLDLIKAANALSLKYLECDMDASVGEGWLTARLRQIDLKRAPRIFNCCRLPEKDSKMEFEPDIYNKEEEGCSIVKLIPQSAVEKDRPGELQTNRLMNLVSVQNNLGGKEPKQKCSVKIDMAGLLGKAVNVREKVHPYLVWLVDQQSKHGKDLDDQKFLEPNAVPRIGDERIEWFVNRLVERL